MVVKAMIEIGNELPEDELIFTASRSSGPGGQNVNKVNTKVTVIFDVSKSAIFSDYQKKRILKCLAGRVNKAGQIRVSSQKWRSQRANRQAVVEKLADLLQQAIKKRPVRKKTRPSPQANRLRLADKRRRSILKKQRAAKKLDVDDYQQ